MIRGMVQPRCEPLAERLDAVRALIVGAGQTDEGQPARVRTALEPLQVEAAVEGDPSVVEALGRLILLAEVWECFAADDPEATGALPDFLAEAIDRLAAALGSSEPGGVSAWILDRSSSDWGDYLALVDPSWAQGEGADAPVEAAAGPSWEEADGPIIDPAELIRRFTGMAGPAASEVSGELPPDEPAGRVALAGAGAEPGVDDGTATPPADRSPISDEPAGPDLIAEARALELDAELRAVFLADLSDLFGRIQGLVLGLGDGDDAGRLHELGRAFHTLKGAAGSVGLGGLAASIHALEDELEAAGGVASEGLVRRLESEHSRLEGVLEALGGDSLAGGTPTVPDSPRATGPARPEGVEAGHRVAQPDGLIRVAESRFDELMDMCSELLTRRRAWAEQSDRMKELTIAARACSHRLRGSVEQLSEAVPRGAAGNLPGRALGGELDSLVRRMAEQAEDLAVLAATAREAALPMAAEAEDLSRLCLRLWEGLQAVRIVPVRSLFQRLVRVARDAARVEGRTVEVRLEGEDTGADRLLVDKIYEPLLHLVRNAVGHGIEPAEDRARAGKPPAGRITLEARRVSNTLVLAVQDDGRGLDYDAIAAKGRRLGLLGPDEQPGADRLGCLIFEPGFSTRGEANEVSGRGVGMDVVAHEVESLRGRIELTSEAGRGTRVEIRLPARLSLEHLMVVRVGVQPFAVPTSDLEAIRRASAVELEGDGAATVAVVDGLRLPMIDLGAALGFSCVLDESCPIVLVLRPDAGPIALRVDGVDGPCELVVKPLGPLLAGHPAISGAGLTTGGEVIPTLDVAGLLRLVRAGASPAGAILEPPPAGRRPAALVVDDSLSVRRVATRILRSLGFDVDEAADGEQALGRLRDRAYRLILTDLEMPRMDGFALLAELGRTGAMEATPVVVTSTLGDEATRRRVLGLGAMAFVPKPVDAEELAAAVATLLAGEGPPAVAATVSGAASPKQTA